MSKGINPTNKVKRKPNKSSKHGSTNQTKDDSVNRSRNNSGNVSRNRNRVAQPSVERNYPVQNDQILELEITGLNHEGAGVGRYEGYTLFVAGALPREVVRAQVEHTKKNFGFARLLSVIQPSAERVVPPCPVYDQCGGCSLQHVSYAEQLRHKKRIVEDNLKRIGNFDLEGAGITVQPTLGMEEPWRYRNKAQVPIGEEEGGLVGGFYAEKSHRIIDMDECLIQHQANDEVVRVVKQAASQLGIQAYDEEKHTGLLRHVVVRVGANTGEVMVVLITTEPFIPSRDHLIETIRTRIPQVKSIVQNINQKRTNVIFGDTTITLWGSDVIYDTIGTVRFAISARSFYQVNPTQTEVLYNKTLEYAGLNGEEVVIDAYCGIGTISLFLAQKAKHVYGVEIVPEAIADAYRNAELNGITNASFEVGAAEEVIPAWKEQGIRPDVIVVDPPRKGCDEALLMTILQMRPERVVYVSCNPSTLARDLKMLGDLYELKEVQPVDMFPHTGHVESVVRLDLI